MTNASLWSMFRLIALAILAIPIYAQNTANPYDLARSIDSRNVDWASIWRKLGVTKPPDMPRCEIDWQCSADVITVLNPSQAIVVVVAKPEDVYLRFLGDGAGWRYAGHHIALKKNFGERYEISRTLGKSFLRSRAKAPTAATGIAKSRLGLISLCPISTQFSHSQCKEATTEWALE